MRLNDKVALITGAAGGIGLAAAQRFAEEGARVVLVDLDEAALQAAVATIGAAASYAVADVSQPEAMERVVNVAVERHGRIDVFVANAGIEGDVAPVEDYLVEQFDRVLAINVRGVFLGLKYVVPVMRRQGGGSIVITSSYAGLSGMANLSAYVASKHAVIGLMRSAALECARHQIRVNTVNPGPVETRMMRAIETGKAPAATEQVKAKITQAVPLRRYAEPGEIAAMMVFLASDESSYCTGGVYMVDGGGTA